MIITLTEPAAALLLENVSKQALLKPFSLEAMRFVEALSQQILLAKTSRQYPELMAMAHWLRKAHLLEIQKEFELNRGNKIWLARGTALHFAPANVDTIFMYSWVISLLVGNNNIVRLSSRGSEQVNFLVSLIEALCDQAEFAVIRRKNALVLYDRNPAITEALSAHCDIRVIWGGDDSVKNIRQASLPAHAKEIVFSDKFSMALLQAQALLDATADTLEKLIHQFYNDSFWFDQLACSSPRVVVWLGDQVYIDQARALFWQALDNYCKTRQLALDPARQMLRTTQLFELAAKAKLKPMDFLLKDSLYFTRAELKNLDAAVRDLHRGGQLFLEYAIQDLTAFSSLLTKKDQTLSVYGLPAETLRAWIETLPQVAFDRIVSLGSALNFQTTWDGYALLQELTREVSVTV